MAWGAFLLLLVFFGVMSFVLSQMPDYHERAAKEADYCASILNW